MEQVVAIRFQIRTRERNFELTVDGTEARVGSGGHCEIRVMDAGVAFEHVLFEARTASLYAEVKSTESPVLVNGAQFMQGVLLPGAVLEVGQVQLQAQLVTLLPGSPVYSPQSRRRHGFAVLGCLAVLGGVVWLLLRSAAPTRALHVLDAPQLWRDEQPLTCAQNTASAAAALAQEHWVRGDTARERGAFDTPEAVRAVHEFERAQVCYLKAQQPRAAQAAEGAGVQLRKRLQREFHLHHVRLERALRTADYALAHAEAKRLLAFGKSDPHPYFLWLSGLERQLQLKFGAKKEP